MEAINIVLKVLKRENNNSFDLRPLICNQIMITNKGIFPEHLSFSGNTFYFLSQTTIFELTVYKYINIYNNLLGTTSFFKNILINYRIISESV